MQGRRERCPPQESSSARQTRRTADARDAIVSALPAGEVRQGRAPGARKSARERDANAGDDGGERLCTHLDKRRSHGDGRARSAHRRAHRKASRREGSSGREEGQEELSEHISSSFSAL